MKSLVKFFILVWYICLLDACKDTRQNGGKKPGPILLEIKSNPLKNNFMPLETPVSLARKSINITPCFGGILVSWKNITKTELGARLMIKEDEEMIEKEQYFSSQESVTYTFRGFEAVETSFALTFEDKFGNISDTVYFIGTPLHETMVQKPWTDMRSTIPYDNVSGNISFLWNNSTLIGSDNDRYISTYGSKGCSFTFDFGQVVKLNRMALCPYVQLGYYTSDQVVYGNLNVLAFEMWGTKTLDRSKLGNSSYWLHPNSAKENGIELPEHTFMDDWVYLGRYEVDRLDLKGVDETEIFERVPEENQFEIPDECEPVRIIRFFPLCSSAGCPIPDNWWTIYELSFWGDNNFPQD